MTIRAAQYVRMSTEHQQYSTENQSDVIREYAAKRGMEIVRATPDQRVEQPAVKKAAMARPEDLARMENELKALEKDFAMLDESYGRNVVDLTVARGYLKKLLDNGKVVRFLAQKYPEILAEFQRVVEAMSLEA